MRPAIPLFLLGLAISLVYPASADPLRSADRIDRLIAQLGSSEFADREKAMTELAAIGGRSLDPLRKAAQGNDLEMRRRAEDLIRQIELREESIRLLAGKSIRLSFQGSPLEQALTELNRLTGFSWRINPADLPNFAGTRITLQTDEITTWEAFDRFCAKAGLVVPEPGTTAAKSASLLAGDAAVVPTCYSGGIRVRAITASAAGWGRTNGVFEVPIPLEIANEPKLQWLGVVDVVIVRAVDDRGQELQQCGVGKDGFTGNWDFEEIQWAGRRGIWRKQQDVLDLSDVGHGKQVNVRLRLGAEPARFVKELQGKLIGKIETPPETLAEVNDILRAAGQTVTAKDGSVLKIGEIKQDDRGVTQVAVELQTAMPDDLSPVNFPVNNRVMMNRALVWQLRAQVQDRSAPQLEMRDAAGRTSEMVRYNEASQFDGTRSQYSATLHALPSKSFGMPAKLVLIGKRTVTVEVPFTLKDIPLP